MYIDNSLFIFFYIFITNCVLDSTHGSSVDPEMVNIVINFIVFICYVQHHWKNISNQHDLVNQIIANHKNKQSVINHY